MHVAPPDGDVFDASCSARHVLELISGNWTMLILPALGAARERYDRVNGR
jgi:DNA-binding HxlR family transcriptional regulator